jgi:hypothetical protein
MSAFLCSPEHLSALVNYAAAHARGGCSLRLMPSNEPRSKTDADYTFERLMFENLKSLEARYPSTPPNTREWSGAEYRFKFELHKVRTPVQIIKLAHCYAYQACEHEGWESSEVKKWIDNVERHAIGHLPGYEEAPWGL